MTKLIAHSSGALTGCTEVPGDKSISHRALIIGAVALGRTTVRGLLEAEDVLRTVSALTALGAIIKRSGEEWLIDGVGIGGLTAPEDVIDMGNSGTAARLLIGLLATHDIRAVVTGDHSLRSRPMDRVMEPLSLFGATFDAFEGRRLPLSMHGAAEPIPVEYEVPVASAQIKSALLFAGLNTPGITTIIEREATRDHTEKMLKNFGAEIHVEVAESHRITIRGYAELSGREVFIPGDPSSAAFPGVAALIVPGSEVTIRNIGVNPRRAGLFETLRDMGASLEIANKRISSGEPVADITFRHGPLTGADIPASRAPSMIDEYPIAAVAAAFASGQTLFRGLAELRVKESDRFIAIINGLTSCGVPVRAEGDDILVEGLNGQLPGGAKISVNLDHRVAMAYLVLGLGSEKPVEIDDATAIGTSFPGFLKLMRGLGAKIESVES